MLSDTCLVKTRSMRYVVGYTALLSYDNVEWSNASVGVKTFYYHQRKGLTEFFIIIC